MSTSKSIMNPQNSQPVSAHYLYQSHNNEIPRLMAESHAKNALLHQIKQENASLMMQHGRLDDKIGSLEVILGKLVDSNGRLVYANERLITASRADERMENTNQVMAQQIEGFQRAMAELERVIADLAKKLESFIRTD